ncbi:hypothetical protein [Desulforamulus aeronauticus]|uniref:Uncharacterized protein n=1 Tax=Desulforamulus aeronauticus DSM 10349 TaxID=1121421 RepID=A0A1M6PVM9_9FIRM|nr:hypothetical protein [Desulforamulus aeronauticus]SHK11958.1 hypothetical protein SAMN02745123_00735 [Desulforamulus aeronauticus DSM 10349]
MGELGEGEVNVLRTEISNVVKQLEKIETTLTRQREETREDIKRIHERLDAQRDTVTRKECEEYREKCCARQESKTRNRTTRLLAHF